MFVSDRHQTSIPETPDQTNVPDVRCKVILINRDEQQANQLGPIKLRDILHSLKEENESLLQDIEQTLKSVTPE